MMEGSAKVTMTQAVFRHYKILETLESLEWLRWLDWAVRPGKGPGGGGRSATDGRGHGLSRTCSDLLNTNEESQHLATPHPAARPGTMKRQASAVNNAPPSGSVSIAYGHHHDHPLLDGPVKLLKSLSAALDKVMTGNDPDERERDEEVLCFCFPCVSFGSSNAGRAAVRTCFVFLFPLLLLGMFLVNDVGRVVIRSMKLRTEIHDVGSHVKAPNLVNKVSLRRKMVHKFPGYKREIKKKGAGTSVQMVRSAKSVIISSNSTQAMSADKPGATVLNVGKKFVSSRMAGACGTDENGDVIAPPIYAFGASSGGAIIAKLASKMEEEPEKYRPFIFSAINVQIYAPSEQWDWNTPTIFTGRCEISSSLQILLANFDSRLACLPVMQGDDLTKNRVKDRVKAKFQGGPFRVIETSGQKAITPFHFRELYFDDLVG
ncbi:hypothetical protein THAOC_32291 [Thalassiosira oceanica]|uniref:Uncharacterized protein n=1 Tax=Thalassiosira oceanica TaxID=159749 RepID=K0R9G7_THAOC|nr:hypothetical protein THAOC_32291 [Thalassiosira oceanica]|eukprot:EJK48879.1 hypothetical protein THAOC_32291 [Thalassiosira oceanica]